MNRLKNKGIIIMDGLKLGNAQLGYARKNGAFIFDLTLITSK